MNTFSDNTLLEAILLSLFAFQGAKVEGEGGNGK